MKLKKPRKNRHVPLAAAMRAFDNTALWTLVIAGGASPLLRERWPTMGQLAYLASTATSTGSKPTSPSLLSSLMDSVTIEYPSVVRSEDFTPKDPRDEVRARVGDLTYRLFSGLIERPVADIDRALLVADSVDSEVIKHHGFGIRTIVEICLSYTDWAVSRLAPTWPSRETDEEPFELTIEELDAARALVDFGTPPHLVNTKAKQRALEWMTCSALDIPYDAHHAKSAFGRFVRVIPVGSTEPQWMPLAFIPESMAFAIADLLESTPLSPEMHFQFAQNSAAMVRNCLWSFTDAVIGSPEMTSGPAVSPSNVVQWAIPVREDLILLIQITSSLNADLMPFPDEPVVLTIARSLPRNEPTEVPFAGGGITLPPGTRAIPIVVFSTPDHIMALQAEGLLSMSLDDLRWIAATAEGKLDLLNFSQDMSDPDRPRTMGFETIDYWEMWKANGKTLFSGGRKPSFVVIAPHWGDAEWDRAAALCELENALAVLQFHGLRDFVGVRASDREPYMVYSRSGGPARELDPPKRFSGVHVRPDALGASITIGIYPVGVIAGDGNLYSEQDGQILHDMSGSLTHGVLRIGRAWLEAHDGTSVRGHRITLTPKHSSSSSSSSSSSPARAALHASSVEVNGAGIAVSNIDVDIDVFLENADGNSGWIRSQFSSVLYEILCRVGATEPGAAAVRNIWDSASPTMTLNLLTTATQLNNLEQPQGLDPAFVSSVDRIIAEKVYQRGVTVDLYEGPAALALERDILAPIALNHLKEQLGAYESDAVIRYGMRQLQRSLENSTRHIRNVRTSARELDLDWDPIARVSEVSGESFELRRCNEILVEACMLAAPSGTKSIDASGWATLLAAASAYFNATMRSESLYYQVTPTSILIDGTYQISTQVARSDSTSPGGRASYRIDDQFALSLAGEGFVLSDAAAAPSSLDSSGVDDEIKRAFGASASEIYLVLYALAGWHCTPGEGEVASASPRSVTAWVLENTELQDQPDGPSVVEAAIALLTSTSAELQKDSWKPWHARTRKRRLLIQPLPLMSTGELLIAPHYLLAALSAYKNYIDQGMLPWSQPAPPGRLDRALESFRNAKNRALEVDVIDALVKDDWRVLGNVKESKAQRLNVPNLSTEIDAVAGKAGNRIIYVLEAKDPVSAHATPQLRGQLDDFYADGGKKPSYAAQLDRKLADVAPFADNVAEALGLPPSGENWNYEVHALFVTRHPIVAAFVGERFEFTTIGGMLERLNATNVDSGSDDHSRGD
ncbi:hypothetical protein [Clavibacter michiganensis]|uniref:hypothetical protein n=1 Tax=Clavibacter michiganensis TaxID=28447 RepID=UPI0013667399|nr:hypothetical protein [Clavibacter michiganensis]